MHLVISLLLGMMAPPMHASPLAATSTAKSASWEKISDEDGVSVYQKAGEGSPVISLRGEGELPVSPEQLFEVMRDNKTAHLWVPFVAARRDLKALSATERVEMTELRMPWPVSDRYFINTASVERLGGGVLRLVVKSLADFDPAWRRDNLVLGQLHYSEFILTPVDSGRATRLTLEVNSDLQGSVPKWLVNAAQRSWPRDFIQGLRAQLVRQHLTTAAGTQP